MVLTEPCVAYVIAPMNTHYECYGSNYDTTNCFGIVLKVSCSFASIWQDVDSLIAKCLLGWVTVNTHVVSILEYVYVTLIYSEWF